MALKHNHGTLYEDVTLFFDDAKASEIADMEHAYHETVEGDHGRIRNDQGARTFSVLRHIALNLVRREHSHKRGIKARRKRAGWDRDYLLRVFIG